MELYKLEADYHDGELIVTHLKSGVFIRIMHLDFGMRFAKNRFTQT